MRRYVLSEDMIIEESQMVTTIHPLFDAVGRFSVIPFHSNSLYISQGNFNVADTLSFFAQYLRLY